MTRFTRSANGKYVVQGHSYEVLIGTRAQVWHGTAYKTTGGLTKSHLMQNKSGRIVSKSKHASAKREKRLVKAGYGTKKGKFGYVKLNGKGTKKMRGGYKNVSPSVSAAPYNSVGGSRRRKHRGGMVNLPLSPSKFDGQGVGTSGVDLQFIAGNAN